MTGNVFLLATDPHNLCRDVIHSRHSGLKLRVFCLDEEPFHPDSSEIQLYGLGGGSMFAFESVDVTSEKAKEIVEAVQWYADYIQCPELAISAEDPRPGRDIAI